MKTISLKPGKERSLLRRHPWIFESSIERGGADAGETVRVESHADEFLAWAAFSPASKIRARVWSFDPAQRIDAPFFIAACASAVRARGRFDIQSNGLRLVHGARLRAAARQRQGVLTADNAPQRPPRGQRSATLEAGNCRGIHFNHASKVVWLSASGLPRAAIVRSRVFPISG